jgi:hypothetical protein
VEKTEAARGDLQRSHKEQMAVPPKHHLVQGHPTASHLQESHHVPASRPSQNTCIFLSN